MKTNSQQPLKTLQYLLVLTCLIVIILMLSGCTPQPMTIANTDCREMAQTLENYANPDANGFTFVTPGVLADAVNLAFKYKEQCDAPDDQ